MELTDAMLAYTFDLLDKLEVGKTLKFKDISPNRPDLMILCCKRYQDVYRNILFKSNWKELKKVKTFPDQMAEWEPVLHD